MTKKSRAILQMLENRYAELTSAILDWDEHTDIAHWYIVVASVRELRMVLYDCERRLTLDSIEDEDSKEVVIE